MPNSEQLGQNVYMTKRDLVVLVQRGRTQASRSLHKPFHSPTAISVTNPTIEIVTKLAQAQILKQVDTLPSSQVLLSRALQVV